MTYQGWANRSTWNVALYINNEFSLYELAKDCSSYTEFVSRAALGDTFTYDGVSWSDRSLCLEELDELVLSIT